MRLGNSAFDPEKHNIQDVALKGNITANQTVIAVATISTQVIAANPARKYVLLINDSDAVMYLKIGGNGELYKGIRLNANGGSFEMSNSLGNLDTRVINAIHGSAGTKNLLVTEG